MQRHLLRIFLSLLLATHGFTTPAQVVTASFERVFWVENFDSAGTYWRNVNNPNESMLVARGRYLIERKSAAAGLHIFPLNLGSFSDFEVEMRIEIGEKEGSSGGMLLMGQENGRGAFLIEINRKAHYRIMQFNGSQYIPIGKEGIAQGWKPHKAIEIKGVNTLAVRCFSRKYDLFINGVFIESFFEPRWIKGEIGIYIGPASQVQVDKITLRLPADARLSDSLPARERILTDIIISLRQTINAQNNDLDSLNAELRTLTGGKGKKEDFDKMRSDIKALQKENTELKRKVTDLEKFKKSLEKSGDADVIIKLSRLLEEEQMEKNKLMGEIEALKLEIERLKELID